MTPDDNIIVTTHAGLVEWLRRRGIKGPVHTRIKRSDIRGKHVFGSLPIYLAAEASFYTIITMSKNSETPRDLTADEMDALGAKMETFSIQKSRIFPYQGEL